MKEVIVTIIILLLIIFALFSCSSSLKEQEIKQFNTIVIDGTEYSTTDIKSVFLSNRESNTLKITFNDGTTVYTTDYILKNK
jgi:uncharacterized protein YxeA